MKVKQYRYCSPVFLAVCLCCSGCVSGSKPPSHEVSSPGVSGAQGPEIIPGKNLVQTQRERNQSLRRLNSLWRSRHRKKITNTAIPFLNHPLPSVQLRATEIIGRLEDPMALKVLKAMQAKLPKSQDLMSEGALAPSPLVFAVPLAIGRIQSRNLKGQAKVNAVLSGMGLTFNQLVEFTTQLSKTDYQQNKVGNRVVQEVLDVLYVQKKKGGNISALTQKLSLRPGQKLLLQAAGFPVEQEAKLILNYVTRPTTGNGNVGNGDVDWISQYLIDLGPKGRKVALDYGSQIVKQRNTYPYPPLLLVYYVDILYALATEGEPQAKSLLKSFSRDRNRFVSGRATMNLERINNGVLP